MPSRNPKGSSSSSTVFYINYFQKTTCAILTIYGAILPLVLMCRKAVIQSIIKNRNVIRSGVVILVNLPVGRRGTWRSLFSIEMDQPIQDLMDYASGNPSHFLFYMLLCLSPFFALSSYISYRFAQYIDEKEKFRRERLLQFTGIPKASTNESKVMHLLAVSQGLQISFTKKTSASTYQTSFLLKYLDSDKLCTKNKLRPNWWGWSPSSSLNYNTDHTKYHFLIVF